MDECLRPQCSDLLRLQIEGLKKKTADWESADHATMWPRPLVDRCDPVTWGGAIPLKVALASMTAKGAKKLGYMRPIRQPSRTGLWFRIHGRR